MVLIGFCVAAVSYTHLFGVQLAEPRKVFGAEAATAASAGEEVAQIQPPARPCLLYTSRARWAGA